MKWYLIFYAIYICSARDLDEIEHSPFHQRDAKNQLIDVRDTIVKFASSKERISSDVKVSGNASMISNGDIVRFDWVNPNAGIFDMVAVYTPPTRSIQDYLDYRYVTDTEGWNEGSGYFTEMLFNMRADYEIRYLSVDKHQVATVLAKFRISFPDNEAIQGHIALTGVPGEMNVMWNSARVDSPRVKFSLSPDMSDTHTVNAVSTTYTTDDLCGPQANKTSPIMFQDPGFFHTSTLTELKPGMRYFYCYGTDNATGPVQSFLAPPGPDTKVSETYFNGFGDMGAYYPPYFGDSVGAAGVTRLLERDPAQFILHFGDLSYARGRGYIWDQWMTQMSNVSSRIPYMVGVGNHEYDHRTGGDKDPSGAEGQGFHPSWGNYGEDASGECGVPTVHRYRGPENGNGVFWYSFDYGLVHVVQFSSEHDFRPSSRQYRWLEADLKSVDRTKTPWVVVTSHRPLYTSQEDGSNHLVGLHMRMSLEELFYENRVNLHLSGHYHSYERSCAVVSGDCVTHGTVYVMVGTGGFGNTPNDYSGYLWSRYQSSEWYGYQRMRANTTHMTIQWVTAPDGVVRDETTIPLWKEKSQEENSTQNILDDNSTENNSENQSRWQKLADRLINEWQ